MLTLSNLSKTYKNKRRLVHALNDVNLSFADHGLVFILGESGAGKTTLLNLISLQDKPSKGSIIIDNVDITKLNNKTKANIRSTFFGMVFQNYNLIEDFTVYENIKFSLDIQSKSYSREDIINNLKQLSLPEDILDEKAYNLSGGQKQRIAIIRALIKDPKILICDEPTGSLDIDNSTSLFDILKEIAKDRLVIVVSHNEILANKYASRIIKIKQGNIVSDSKPLPIDNTILENKTLNLKKSHLSFKNTFLLSLISFKRVIVRSILSFIALGLSLGIFMCVGELLSYDGNKVFHELITTYDINYIKAEKRKSYDDVNYSYINFDGNDISYISDLFENKDFLLSKSFVSGLFLMSINNEQLANFKFELYGRLPSEDNEVALSVFDLYFLNKTLEESFDLKDYSNNLNKTIGFGSYIFTITGIVDTYIDIEYIFKDEFSSNKLNYDLRNHDNYIQSKIYNCIFVSDNFFNSYGKALYSDLYLKLDDLTLSKVDQLSKLVKMDDKEYSVEPVYYGITNLEGLEQMSSLYSLVGSVIGGVVFIIAILLFISFLNMSIFHQRKTIKILKSQGLTFFDVLNIFNIQTGIVILISTILATIIYSVALALTNQFCLELSMVIVPCSFDFLIVFLIFLIALIIALALCILILSISNNEKEEVIK